MSWRVAMWAEWSPSVLRVVGRFPVMPTMLARREPLVLESVYLDLPCYAGIGSRRTPADVLALMRMLARRLASAGWLLRTGGAPGADQAFQVGAEQADGRVELYLPWPGFEGFEQATLVRPSRRAYDIAAEHHPAWENLRRAARALHARNSHQILGRALDRPCSFVVCWTDDASLDGESGSAGGTGQALRIASRYGVPVFNLAVDEHRDRVRRFAAAP